MKTNSFRYSARQKSELYDNVGLVSIKKLSHLRIWLHPGQPVHSKK